MQNKEKDKEVGAVFPCDQCEYTASGTSNLRRHKKRQHLPKDDKYPRDENAHAAPTAWGPGRPKQSTAGAWGPGRPQQSAGAWGSTGPNQSAGAWGSGGPNQRTGVRGSGRPQQSGGARGLGRPKQNARGKQNFDHVNPQKSAFAFKDQSKPEGMRYPCDQCEYSATGTSNLRRHKKRQHLPK